MPRLRSSSTSSLRSMARSGSLFGWTVTWPSLLIAEVALAPVLDAVGFEGVVELPGGVEVGGVGIRRSRVFPIKGAFR